VVERPRVSNRCLNTHLCLDKNGDRAGPLGGSVEPSNRKGGESAVAIPRFSMWKPPPVSVKDRGVGAREQVLNVPIACP
jgi:hypothetical protein